MDLSSLQTENGSFVDEDMAEVHSDLLYSVKFTDENGKNHQGLIYLLMEHKSYPDPFTALQLLRYMTSIWKTYTDKKATLPFILPLVLYHGQTEWEFGLDFASLIDTPTPAYQKYAVDFNYLLWDLSKIPDEDLKSHVLLGAFLLSLKHIRDSNFHTRLPEILDLMADLYASEKSGLEDLRSLLIYILRASDGVDGKEVIRYIEDNPVAKEKIMPTAAEIITKEARRQAEEKGIQQGMQQGVQQGKLEDARKMLEKGYPVADVLEITGLTEADLSQAGLVQ